MNVFRLNLCYLQFLKLFILWTYGNHKINFHSITMIQTCGPYVLSKTEPGPSITVIAKFFSNYLSNLLKHGKNFHGWWKLQSPRIL
jgi:hypothetical protein